MTDCFDKVIVLDFGSPNTPLIARRVMECGVHSHIYPWTVSTKEIMALPPKGIIFSGGPERVKTPGSPRPDAAIYSLGIPVLGICYGIQVIADMLGGNVTCFGNKEYGWQNIHITDRTSMLLNAVPEESLVWMNHWDSLDKIPEGFSLSATTPTCPIAAIEDKKRKIYGVQFHPEVIHESEKDTVISSFVLDICNAKPDSNMVLSDNEIVASKKQ